MTKNEYSLLKDINLIIQIHMGKMTFGDLVGLKKRMMLENDLTGHTVIVDVRDAEIAMEINEIYRYREFVNQHPVSNENGKIRIGVLVRKPDQIAKGAIFLHKADFVFVNYRMFSSLEACLDWLNISRSELFRIHSCILDMKTDYIKEN